MDNWPPIGVMNTITEGQFDSITKNLGWGEVVVPTNKQKIKNVIAFSEEDAQEIQFPHNNAIIVSLNIAIYGVYRILIDNGSSIDKLFYDTFFKMSFTLDRLGKLDS